MEKFKVAIIGTGPSAAFSYLACKDYGCSKIDIYGKYHKDFPQGAFWFKWLPSYIIKDTKVKKCEISIIYMGTNREYVQKQWGEEESVDNYSSTFSNFDKLQYGYDPLVVWDRMWSGANFIETKGMFTDIDLKQLSVDYDFIFHTFPSEASLQIRKTISIPTVSFHIYSQPLYHVLRMMNPKFNLGEQIIYDGRIETPIVRISSLFGHINIEFVKDTDTTKLFPDGVTYGKFMDIPPNTEELVDEDRLDLKVYPVGRYAQWERHLLSHNSYRRVMGIFTRA